MSQRVKADNEPIGINVRLVPQQTARNEQITMLPTRLLWVKSGQRSSAFVPQPEVRNHVASTARPNLGPLGTRERLGSLELARSLPCKDLPPAIVSCQDRTVSSPKHPKREHWGCEYRG